MAKTSYIRLTRARARHAFAIAFVTRTSLWLGEDHLLCADSTGYSEKYKRFYFRDIQMITLQASSACLKWNVAWGCGILFVLCAFLEIRSVNPSGSGFWLSAIFGPMAALFALFILLNSFWLGPACRVSLHTAVQSESLPTLRRIRHARRVLAKIEAQIAAAQGRLTTAEVGARLREGTAVPAETLVAPTTNP